MTDLRDPIARALGRPVATLAPLRGGDVADAFRAILDDGTTVFAKTHPDAPPGFFTTEAAGLAWLRQVNAVPIPEVLAVSDDPPLLVLEWIEPGRPGRATDPECHHLGAQQLDSVCAQDGGAVAPVA